MNRDHYIRRPPGRFITLEGIDGAGKSTHIPFIRDWLATRQIEAVFTREPGGTPVGERIRELLLAVDTEASLDTETLLMFASRQQLLDSVIKPALEAGKWLVSDRFTDSTFAFQGGGRGVPHQRIQALEQWVQQGLQPDLTILFDLPLEVAAARMSQGNTRDRFEREHADFHARVRVAYQQRAAGQARFVVLDAERSISAIQADIAGCLQCLLDMA
ncbi:dTMP kinase [Neisseriaceae bacterium TC5R-5]|nr:dTMP kinase [Neisseriaceae bacterium TC5R-5]